MLFSFAISQLQMIEELTVADSRKPFSIIIPLQHQKQGPLFFAKINRNQLSFFLSFRSKMTTYDKEAIADANVDSSRILLHSGLAMAANQIRILCASSENAMTGYTPDSRLYDAFR